MIDIQNHFLSFLHHRLDKTMWQILPPLNFFASISSTSSQGI